MAWIVPCLFGFAAAGPVADLQHIGVKDPIFMLRKAIEDPTTDLLEGLLADPESEIDAAFLNTFQEKNYWGFAGYSPIMYACFKKDKEEHLDVMLKAGGKHNIPNEARITPVHVASANNHSKAVKVLLKAGANPRFLNSQGMNAATLAARPGNLLVLRALFDHGGGATLSLTEYDKTTNKDESKGWAPLHYAVRNAHVAVVRFLVFEVGWGNVKKQEVMSIAKQHHGQEHVDELKKLADTESSWFEAQKAAHLEAVAKEQAEHEAAAIASKDHDEL